MDSVGEMDNSGTLSWHAVMSLGGEGGVCWLVRGLRRLDWVAETIAWCCEQMPDMELRALGTVWHQGRNTLWT
jgi:hypothetical protein